MNIVIINFNDLLMLASYIPIRKGEVVRLTAVENQFDLLVRKSSISTLVRI